MPGGRLASPTVTSISRIVIHSMKQQTITRNVPVYHVHLEEGRLQAWPHTQVVDEIFTVTPEMAVRALKDHNVEFLYVPIRDGAIEELKRRWAGELPSTTLPNAVAKLKELYLNQRGDVIFVPRDVVSDIIEQMFDVRTLHTDLLLEGEHLTPTQGRIVDRLMQVPGVVVPPSVLSEDSDCTEESLWVHIRRLRDKLDPAKACLRTVRLVGYYMEVKDAKVTPTPIGVSAPMQ